VFIKNMLWIVLLWMLYVAVPVGALRNVITSSASLPAIFLFDIYIAILLNVKWL